MLKDSQFHSEGFVTKVLVYNVLLNFGGISPNLQFLGTEM